MTRISRHQLSESVFNQIFQLFLEVLGQNKSKQQLRNVIRELLTYTEQVMIAKRIAILYLLLRGIDRRNISQTLKVSSETISKFSILLDLSIAIKPILQTRNNKDKLSLLLEELFHTLFGPGTYGIDWKAARERRRSIARKKARGI